MAREYKDSGIEWIGLIPKEWEVTRFKFVSEMYTGNSLNEQQKELYSNFEIDETLPYIATKDVERDIERIDYEGGIRIPLFTDNFSIAPKNSVLLCIEGGSAGKKVGYTNQDVYFVNKLCCIKTDKNSRYFYYFILSHSFSEPFLQNIQGLIGGVSISTLKNFVISVPPLLEQQKIADYLDKVCGEVDEMVALQETMIEELKAYKQSVITEAVTKGLNPNAPMRNSGIDWMGEIPEHWEITKIKRIANTNSGSTPRNISDGEDSNIIWIRTTDINDDVVYGSSLHLTAEEFSSASCPMLDKGTCVVAMYGGGGTIGKSGMLGVKATINQALCSMEVGDSFTGEYLFCILRSVRYYWMKYAVGTRKDPNINQEIVRNLIIPFPPIDEQRAIASYLDTKCSEIDSLIAIKQAKIEELKEYKKSVIYEYVTGKKEVS